MKKILSVIVASALSLSAFMQIAYANEDATFSDVPSDHWAYESIEKLVSKGVVNGYEDGTYRPDNFVTRAEWSKIFVEVADLPENEFFGILIDLGAVDADAGDWYAEYLIRVSPFFEFEKVEDEDGWVGTYYKPNQFVTREEVVRSLVNLKGYCLVYDSYSRTDKFSDSGSIDAGSKAHIEAALENGIISGYEDNTFRADNCITRSEIAIILLRAFKDYEKYSNYDKVLNGDFSDFAGVWKTRYGETINLKADGTEGLTCVRDDGEYRQVSSDIHVDENGAILWGVNFDFYDEENGSYCIWIYPPGTEVTGPDQYADGGGVVSSDISRPRLYAGHDLMVRKNEDLFYLQ